MTTTSLRGGRLRRLWPLAAMAVAVPLVLLGGRWLHAADLFLADNMKFVMPPDRTVGAGNGQASESVNGSPFHFIGEDCARCHVEGGKATNYVFTMAGTMYRDYAGTEVLPGAEIILQDAAGKIVSMTSNEEGNFFTYEPIRGAYKAWVKYGERTTPMVTLAPAGHTAGWMSCNMHHAPTTWRGALFVGGLDPTLPAYPATEVSFRRHVQPILLHQCRPCHLPAAAAPITKQVIGGQTYAYDYSGGVDLTSYAGLAAARAKNAALVDTANPAGSTLLTKVALPATTEHAGGAYWGPEDPDWKAIAQWIAEGAQDN